LEWAAKEFPKFTASALKSTGWMMQKEIKKGITSKAPGGKAYLPTMPAKKRKLFEQAFGRVAKGQYPVMGKLKQAIGYEFNKKRMEVTVGWLSISAVQLGKKLEEGFRTPVSDRTRRALARVGIFARSDTWDVPPRPTIGPMFDYLEPRIHPYLEEKIWSKVEGQGQSGTARNPRKKYIVKGEWW
jgi:hypothetical protein